MTNISLSNHTCPNCGGDFILSVNSQYAQCENCGNTASVDADELAKIRKILTGGSADSTEFIEFMLEIIKKTLEEISETTCASGTSQEQVGSLLEFCKTPRTRREMQEFVGVSGRKAFNNNYLRPLLEQGKLAMTVPDKPNSRNQKYYTK